MIVSYFAVYFIALPPINPTSLGFWISILVSMVIALVFTALVTAIREKKRGQENLKEERVVNIFFALGCLIILIMIIGGIISTKIFHVNTYRSQISVENVEFADVIPESASVSDIAIMDTETAEIIGKRAMGSLTELVSQYEVGENYSTISLNNRPMKVSCLEYGGLIKYLNNSSTGVPGYIQVDPVKNTAEFVKTDKPIQYVESAIFSKDLYRHIRSKYLSEIIYDMYFEIDDSGNPYWICPVVKHMAWPFGAEEITDVIIVNACDGSMEKVTVANVPQWVDRVYDGDLLCDYYDSYGTLQSGFWNSVFGNRGCTVTTDDYGYKIIDDDVWLYTGVTSVASDESNLGFLLINERTREAKYFLCAGAEEYSAMSAAEGMVQDLGYTAAFPSIINIAGQPTYICCLKDGSGLVKMYALVNVTQYNLVGTGQTPTDALKSYQQILQANGLKSNTASDNLTETSITVESIEFIAVSGDTTVYIKSTDGKCFKMAFADNEELILIGEGDKLTVTHENTDKPIIDIVSFVR